MRKLVMASAEILYGLRMNSIFANAEAISNIGPFTSPEEARRFYNECLEEVPYTEDGYYKVFKKGSPLEQFNALTEGELVDARNGVFGHGLFTYFTDFDVMEVLGDC